MKVKKATKLINIFKRIFKIRQWLDIDRIKAAGIFIRDGFKKVFFIQERTSKGEIKKEETQHQNFKKAVTKMQLSQESLQEKQTSLLRLSLLMCASSLALIGYSIYQLTNGAYKATIISIVLSLIALALAFRYHFWYFQIKEHRLGCSIREWFAALKGARGNKP